MKNVVSLIGRIGDDPQLKTTESGKKVCNMSMATTAKWKNDANEKVEKTEWNRLVAWGKQAEVISEYVKKGHLLAIEGRIEYRDYVNKEGVKSYATDIVIDDFHFINPKTSG